jgi:hypothetical protein
VSDSIVTPSVRYSVEDRLARPAKRYYLKAVETCIHGVAGRGLATPNRCIYGISSVWPEHRLPNPGVRGSNPLSRAMKTKVSVGVEGVMRGWTVKEVFFAEYDDEDNVIVKFDNGIKLDLRGKDIRVELRN